MDSHKIVVTESIAKNGNSNTIIYPNICGFCISKFREKLLEDESNDCVDNIISNGIKAILEFKNPDDEMNFNKPRKILCLGKVQSGKTSFFLSTIALAFDNGYNLAVVLGGTKIKLKEQNLERIEFSFSNNEKIKIFNVTKNFNQDLRQYIENGYKIILVILKNASEKTNLGCLKFLASKYDAYNTVIVDDEGDEFTPGNPKSKTKAGNRTHDKIASIISLFKVCTFLSVTATPQANFLISTLDALSPDALTLVRPGAGYTGGKEFFDLKSNKHVSLISDNDDFELSIPDSFINALNFFIFACALKRSIGDTKPYSMLVHPSSFTETQNTVGRRINGYISDILKPLIFEKNTNSYNTFLDSFKYLFDEYISDYPQQNVKFEEFACEIHNVITKISTSVVNYSTLDHCSNENDIYNIKVGGNMLGRGLTIDRLIVSYIYRDSKQPAIDTMYQRCRWFGYKGKYFDVCRVYMTEELQNKFLAIVSHETQMWNAIEAFLETNVNIKQFPRIFELNNDNLILTRRSISKTVTLKIFANGHKDDKWITPIEERDTNRKLLTNFMEKHVNILHKVDFDNSDNHRQQHYLYQMKFTEFYNEFLSNYIFANMSNFNLEIFRKIYSQIVQKQRDNNLLVMVMRPDFCEKRKPDSVEQTVDLLFQGRNDSTEFSGDMNPKDINGIEYCNITFIQIHLVKLFDSWTNDMAFPMLSFNNPYTSETIKLVTGDNIYE